MILGSDSLNENDKETFSNRPFFDKILWPFNNISTIFYDDPTRNLDNVDLLGGWGIGNSNYWCLNEISKIIKIIANKIYDYNDEHAQYGNIIFYGESMAGFMSLQLSILTKNSTSLVEKPQLDVSKLDYWPIIKQELFGDISTSKIKNEFIHRINTIDLMIKESYIPNLYLILDQKDEISLKNQLDLFNRINELPFDEFESNKIKVYVRSNFKDVEELKFVNLFNLLDEIYLIDSNRNSVYNDLKDYFYYNKLSSIQQSKLLKYMTCRIDLKNFGINNSIELLNFQDYSSKIYSPSWINNHEGKGIIIESFNGELNFKFKCINDGVVKIFLRGINYFDNNSNRLPIYINFNYLMINDDEIINNDTITWHNKPFIYEKNVKDGEIITVHVKWKPC